MAQDQVAQEVTLAHLEVQAGPAQIEYAAQYVREAAASLDLNLRHSRAAEGLPIEALQAIRANAQAKQAMSEALGRFNRAQSTCCRRWAACPSPQSSPSGSDSGLETQPGEGAQPQGSKDPELPKIKLLSPQGSYPKRGLG